MTTATACAEKAKLQAMVCAFEKIFALDENEEEVVLADTFVIAKFKQSPIFNNMSVKKQGSVATLIQSAPSVSLKAVASFFYLKLKSIIVD